MAQLRERLVRNATHIVINGAFYWLLWLFSMFDDTIISMNGKD